MKRKEFIIQRPKCCFWKNSFADYFCTTLFSPFLTPFFINHNVRPNTVTLLMIISGFITGFVLMVPNEWCKLASFFLYILWFSLDCSDGEVARATNKCSDYGKHLDWIAHIVCHPLFCIGMWFTFLQYYTIDIYLISTIIMGLLSMEMILRMLVAFREYVPESKYKGGLNQNHKINLFSYIKGQLGYFPNIVIFSPLLVFFDIIFKLNCFHYLFIIWAVLYMLTVLKQLVSVTHSMYKA